MFKKLITGVLSFLLLFSALTPGAVMAADNVSLPAGSIALYIGSNKAYVNNVEKFIDPGNSAVTPIIQNSRTVLPVSFVSENYGCAVKWDGSTKKVTVKNGEDTVVMQINNKTMYKNGVAFTSDVAPFIRNGRTYVPIKVLSESIGKNVFYNNKLVLISSQGTTFDNQLDQPLINAVISKYADVKLTVEQIADFDKSTVMLTCLDSSKTPYAQGSGFYIGNGVIVTNYHVIENAQGIIAETEDNKQYNIQGVVASDQSLDLAMLKISVNPDMKPLTLGFNKTIVKGQQIVTIGSPEGLKNTVSDGIISGFRTDSGVNLIQISAPITYGSSGGPLFNMYGQVIGVNSSGMDSGSLNFSISINHLYNWYAEKIAGKAYSDIPVIKQYT
ncbi:MAG TPA: stalk domain-containing protein [Ruminiclostridium sp.]|nr:stalk domain-containing protein [Ruminiclostridium sp.]